MSPARSPPYSERRSAGVAGATAAVPGEIRASSPPPLMRYTGLKDQNNMGTAMRWQYLGRRRDRFEPWGIVFREQQWQRLIGGIHGLGQVAHQGPRHNHPCGGNP